MSTPEITAVCLGALLLVTMGVFGYVLAYQSRWRDQGYPDNDRLDLTLPPEVAEECEEP